MPDISNHFSPRPLFHGTSSLIAVGEVISPSGKRGVRSVHDIMFDDPALAVQREFLEEQPGGLLNQINPGLTTNSFATEDIEEARKYAKKVSKTMGGEPMVYRVEPVDASTVFEDEFAPPSVRFDDMVSWRSPDGFRVTSIEDVTKPHYKPSFDPHHSAYFARPKPRTPGSTGGVPDPIILAARRTVDPTYYGPGKIGNVPIRSKIIIGAEIGSVPMGSIGSVSIPKTTTLNPPLGSVPTYARRPSLKTQLINLFNLAPGQIGSVQGGSIGGAPIGSIAPKVPGSLGGVAVHGKLIGPPKPAKPVGPRAFTALGRSIGFMEETKKLNAIRPLPKAALSVAPPSVATAVVSAATTATASAATSAGASSAVKSFLKSGVKAASGNSVLKKMRHPAAGVAAIGLATSVAISKRSLNRKEEEQRRY